MKNLLGKGLALLVLSAATLTSCKKDKEESTAITKESLVGNYTLVEVREKVGADEELDTTNEWVDECEKDDKVTLNANMTYTYSDAGTKCDPNGDGTGSWSFDETEKSIEIETLAISGDIEKSTSTELVIKQVFDEGGFYYSMRWFFKKN